MNSMKTTTGPARRPTQTIHTRYGFPTSRSSEILFDMIEGLWWAIRALTRVVYNFPYTTAALTVPWVALRFLGPWGMLACVLGVVVGTFLSHSDRYPRFERYRRARRLRRTWEKLCQRVGLEIVDTDRRTGDIEVWHPVLGKLTWTTDDILVGAVSMVQGQTVAHLSEVAERLAAATTAAWCRVRQTGPANADIILMYGDPLQETIPPIPVPPYPDIHNLVVGACEDGSPWSLKLASTHLLIAGATGAGKSSVLWSLLAALGGGIRSGTVQVWAVDEKGGMELTPGRPMFTRFATTVDDGVLLLEEAAAMMTARAEDMAKRGIRFHTPTPGDPTVVVVVDEVAMLTAYTPDKKARERAISALSVLASQGRAPGVVLIGALQDPRKEIIWLRNLFPTRIGMRLDEAIQVDMVLGDGAREAGALCHKIPESTPGVGYVKIDGVREPMRVRAAYLPDDYIHALAANCPAPSWTGQWE